MNFTDSPFEKMMKEVPPAPRLAKREPPVGSACRGCSYRRGMDCVGICYRELTSGNIGAPAELQNSVGKGGATARAGFGPNWPEVAEQSLRRRGPKLAESRGNG